MAATERGGKNRGKQKNDTETLILGRMPPQNIEAEMAVLGAMLLDKDAIEVAEKTCCIPRISTVSRMRSFSRRF